MVNGSGALIEFAAWTRGVDITTQTGLRRVVESVGLDWQTLNDMSRGTDWQADQTL